jgi:hypothetical protein
MLDFTCSSGELINLANFFISAPRQKSFLFEVIIRPLILLQDSILSRSKLNSSNQERLIILTGLSESNITLRKELGELICSQIM